jgi:DNA topoisomerase-3
MKQMPKSVYIAEKPSVAQEFAKALKNNFVKHDGYLESEDAIVTWCVGHLVTMSYPEKYDPALKSWKLETLPFIPAQFKYEIIDGVKKQFEIVKKQLTREDVSTIYVCTDSGREGEYIYRLVDQAANVQGKEKRRVWIDSQTEEEILRGIQEAKELSSYDNLSAAAYLRAKEDYLMGINFSRLLTLKYGYTISNYLKEKRSTVIAVGRVMTCVLGMVVNREREIRNFDKTPFYRVLASVGLNERKFDAEWKAVEGSKYYNSPLLYKENGFKKKESAEQLVNFLKEEQPVKAIVAGIEKKIEKKNPPLLYNLAELQNDCSRMFKVSPDETLKIVQELYEKKLVTYPRTDARVISTAVSKEIHKNIGGLKNYGLVSDFASEILANGNYKNIAKTRYCDDKQITDHYAIIPTGQGFGALNSVSPNGAKVYETIVRRFLAIFYPAAEYQKLGLTLKIRDESFFANFRVLIVEGYLKIMGNSFDKKSENENEDKCDIAFMEELKKIKKGTVLGVEDLAIKEGETSPPKRYSSGSIILAMENAGQLIEDETLREQIKGSGIGTSATRAEILKKLINNNYIALNKKTQILSTTQIGEMIYDVVNNSIRQLLNPELSASWEKGLTYVAEGSISESDYMVKLNDFISKRTSGVVNISNQGILFRCFDDITNYYKKEQSKKEVVGKP